MKILFLIPDLKRGGVAKMISLKANYLIQNKNHDVAIVTQNNGNESLFFELNSKVQLFDINLKVNKLKFIFEYKKHLDSVLKTYNPNLIVIADNGLKAFLIPIIINTKIPKILEIHSSINVLEKENSTLISKIKHNLVLKFKSLLVNKFSNIIVLSNQSKEEWNIKNATIILNPVKKSEFLANPKNKKIICVTRNAYEKGVDRIIPIWLKIFKKYPDWTLHIFCEIDGYFDLEKLILKNKFSNIFFHKQTQKIETEYLNASVFISTSRFETFPLVILEAMSFALPIVAYNCPIGIQSVLKDSFSYLVKDGHHDEFVFQLERLMIDENLRKNFGIQAKLESEKYDETTILSKYTNYLNNVLQSAQIAQSIKIEKK